MRNRRVFMYDINNELKVIYPSLACAELEGYNRHIIGKVANSRSKFFGKMYKGYKWRYTPLQKDKELVRKFSGAKIKIELGKQIQIVYVRTLKSDGSLNRLTLCFNNLNNLQLKQGDHVLVDTNLGEKEAIVKNIKMFYPSEAIVKRGNQEIKACKVSKSVLFKF